MSNTTPKARNIVVGVDGSPNSIKAVDWATDYAHEGDTVMLLAAWSPVLVPAEMTTTYTFDDTGARALLEKEVNRITPSATARGVKITTQFENNDPRTALLAAKSDLIVVGARGHGAIMGLLLGSVADYISRHAKVPVVIVPVPK